MNMGGPADHWYTDLFSWKRPAFGEPVDSLVRDIRTFGGDHLLRDDQPLGRRLSGAWGRADGPDLRRLAAELTPVRDDLRAKAEAGGWEIG